MSKLKKAIIMLILFIFTIASMYSMSYAAAVKVTDENLKSALEKLVSSNVNDDEMNKITVENKQIKIISDEENYTLNYDLTSKPTFTYEVDINQGMSYEDYQEKTGGLLSTMIGYIAVANIQGIDYEDSLAYFSMCLLSSAFSSSGLLDLSNSYTIVDDTQEGVTVEKDPNNTKIIYVSEFGNHVMEYVNAIYSEKQSFNDKDGLNTFEMTREMKDETSTSCKIVTTLTVDTDANFSQMKGYSEQISNSFNGNNSNNNSGSSSSSSSSNYSSNASSNSKDDTTSKTTLPKAGDINTIIVISAISIIIIIAVIFGIKNRKYKDIK